MGEEGATERGSAIDATHASANATGQWIEVLGGRVGQGGGVEVRPELFDRIQLGGIGGKPLHPEPSLVAFEGLLDVAAAMGGQAVPQQDDRASPMPSQGLEKTRHLGAAHAASMQGQQPAGASTVSASQHRSNP